MSTATAAISGTTAPSPETLLRAWELTCTAKAMTALQIGRSLPLALVILLSLLIMGCAGPTKPSQFEIDFYAALERIGPQDSLTDLDLSAITPFAWDSVLIVKGDDESALDAATISYYLHRPTEDLPDDAHRFYFTRGESIVSTITIKKASQQWRNTQWWLVPCSWDSTNCAVCEFHWLSREECMFKAKLDMKYGRNVHLRANCPDKKAQHMPPTLNQ